MGIWLVIAVLSMPGPMLITAAAEARRAPDTVPLVVTPAEAADRNRPLDLFGKDSHLRVAARMPTCPLCSDEVPVDSDGAYCPKAQCQWTQALEAKHPRWGRETCVLIGRHVIRIGMSREQVRESWGSPTGVSSSIHGSRVYEHWRWGSYLTGGVRQSVMFVNGRLESIHTY